jgi:surfeit locus 1 family protein
MDRRWLSFKWIGISLLVLVLAGVMVRLGFWQLDRLKQRRESNAITRAQMAMSPVDLNTTPDPPGLDGMEYRPAMVRGVYNFSEQVVLRNRSWQGQPGGHLLTPLIIEGTKEAVIVDRGWIPLADVLSGDLSKYDEPGVVEVRGAIRLSQTDYPIGSAVDPTIAPGGSPLRWLNLVNLDRLNRQVSERLLPVFIQQQPDSQWTRLPDRVPAEPDLSDGPHLSYAIQWFSFTAILLVGYPVLLRKQLAPGKRQA